MRQQTKDNIVYIGSKPIKEYCTAVLSVLAYSDLVRLIARGNAISRAVSVAEVTRNRYISDLIVDSIDLDSEELESETGGLRNVSTITIQLKLER